MDSPTIPLDRDREKSRQKARFLFSAFHKSKKPSPPLQPVAHNDTSEQRLRPAPSLPDIKSDIFSERDPTAKPQNVAAISVQQLPHKSFRWMDYSGNIRAQETASPDNSSLLSSGSSARSYPTNGAKSSDKCSDEVATSELSLITSGTDDSPYSKISKPSSYGHGSFVKKSSMNDMIRPQSATEIHGNLAGPDHDTRTVPLPSVPAGGSQKSKYEVKANITPLPPLQYQTVTKPDLPAPQNLSPVCEDDPQSWELPSSKRNPNAPDGEYVLEQRARELYSEKHLGIILSTPRLLLSFTHYLDAQRPHRMPSFIQYLDILRYLDGLSHVNSLLRYYVDEHCTSNSNSTDTNTSTTGNQESPHRAERDSPWHTPTSIISKHGSKIFDSILQEDLPAFIAYQWSQIVSLSTQRGISGKLSPHLRNASEGLAEVFCLTDPSIEDNPIIFVSEQFTRTTEYGIEYACGRNCRFLQGPGTSQHSILRIREACKAGRPHTEVFLNYRRNGSPFMNLLMVAPLVDGDGKIRYFLGAQVDVSALLLNSSKVDGLKMLLDMESRNPGALKDLNPPNFMTAGNEAQKVSYKHVSDILDSDEFSIAKKYRTRMHQSRGQVEEHRLAESGRIVLHEPLATPKPDCMNRVKNANDVRSIWIGEENFNHQLNPGAGRLPGIYEHYLVVRPSPSLRVLFTSPTLSHVPNLLQAQLLDWIGGSEKVRSELGAALEHGRDVTAHVRWLKRSRESLKSPSQDSPLERHADVEDTGNTGQLAWIHCTPLLDCNNTVGVWVIILVEDDV